FEMLSPHEDSPVKDGWRSTEVRDSLDLCLSCKGCKSDCPVNVDMATYKAEFLHHHYKGRIRPAAHYSIGGLPLLARIASWVPRLVNRALSAPGLSTIGKKAAGIAVEPDAPAFAGQTRLAGSSQRTDGRSEPARRAATTVVVWPDTFHNRFDPRIGRPAVALLESAGFDVVIPDAAVSSGVTWFSTGPPSVTQKVF